MIEINELTPNYGTADDTMGGAGCGFGTCSGMACGVGCPISSGSACGWGCNKPKPTTPTIGNGCSVGNGCSGINC